MRVFAALALLLGLWVPLAAAPDSFTGPCLSVVDGDTIDVSVDGAALRVRIEGVDCPENGEPFAEAAKEFTTRLLEGKTVEVVVKEKDRYGRTVGRVFVDGRDVSVELLRAGLASHYVQYNGDWLLAELETLAKAGGAGMWAAPGKAPVVYHGNVRSRVFHAPACPDYNCRHCTRVFESRDEAVAAGFRPCGTCRP